MSGPEAQLEDDDRELEQRLDGTRPKMEPATASGLRQRLAAAVSDRFTFLRNTRKRALGYIGVGALLLAVAILGLAGAGPFAA